MEVARFPISDFCFVRPTEYSDKVVCRLMGACAVVGGSSVNKWVGDGRAQTTDLQHCSNCMSKPRAHAQCREPVEGRVSAVH